jgi:ATP-dependent helicase/nuclease subunit A
LLQHLVSVPRDRRDEVALKALAALLPEAPEMYDEIAADALAVLTDPSHSELFGPNTRPETAFTLQLLQDGVLKILNGRMDRVVLSDTHALIVDFKSDANPPKAPENAPAGYLTQLGLYALAGEKLFAPLEINAAIFWTQTRMLMRLPPELLRKNTAGFTLA